MRLIDADALYNFFLEMHKSGNTCEPQDVLNAITNAPTVQREGWVSVEGKVGTFCTVHQADKSKCQLHNLHCAYPSCCTAAPTDKE